MSSKSFSIAGWHSDYAAANSSPSYDSSSLLSPEKLISASEVTSIESFSLGTGSSLYAELKGLILANTSFELLLTTCFWAPSLTSNTIADLLRALSAKACSQPDAAKIRVRICLSSLSLWQKLVHTRSPAGRVMSSDQWPQSLNLPSPAELPGLEVQVKSVFIRPFSVMHPKFIVCDRSLVVMPSCNVSWEDWFEGALVVRENAQWSRNVQGQWQRSTGAGLVSNLVELWRGFWGCEPRETRFRSGTPWQIPEMAIQKHWIDATGINATAPVPSTAVHASTQSQISNALPRHLQFKSLPPLPDENTPQPATILLPHPHHANPSFSLGLCRRFPFFSLYSDDPRAPHTPLNDFLLALLASARDSVLLVTPNLTAPCFIHAIKQTLARGVAVTLVTNRNLMVLEQLATAGTTTQRQVARLQAWHRNQQQLASGVGRLGVGWFTALAEDEAAAATGPLASGGTTTGWQSLSRLLRLRKHHIRLDSSSSSTGGNHAESLAATQAHPVRSHLKLTLVDGEVVVLGSGNLDRASAHTSQELGVAVEGARACGGVATAVEAALAGRVVWDRQE